MINEFDFCRPSRLAEALEAVSRPGTVVPIAGGTNVMVNMKRAPLVADAVVDLTGIERLKEIEEVREGMQLGAAVTLAQLLDWHPGGPTEELLRPMASQFAGPLIRNLATVGGNLCDASPAADLSPPLLVLRARVKLESAHGSRWLPLEEFFLGVRKTARRWDEILTVVEVSPPQPGARCFYYKLGKRKADAISIVSVAMTLEVEGQAIRDARIALGAVAPVAMRAKEAEELLKGSRASESVLSAAAAAAAAEARPVDDFRASARYRRDMIETLVLRGLRQMTAR